MIGAAKGSFITNSPSNPGQVEPKGKQFDYNSIQPNQATGELLKAVPLLSKSTTHDQSGVSLDSATHSQVHG